MRRVSKISGSLSCNGFSLLEAVLVMLIISIAFFGFGYLYGNIDQEALKADLTVLATKLAKEKMEEVIQTKADSGYASVSSQTALPASSGAWTFQRMVNTSFVNPADFSVSPTDTGYKKVEVVVSWGAGGGESITLTTLVTDMVPSTVVGPNLPQCP